MKKLTLSQMEMQSRKFMSYSSPIQSEKENSSNSRVIKANTGLGVQCQNKQYLEESLYLDADSVDDNDDEPNLC